MCSLLIKSLILLCFSSVINRQGEGKGNINHSEEEAEGGGLRHHAEREEVVGAGVK